MIATLAEIKVLLGITDTSKDALITALIPIVEIDLLEETNNDFKGSISFGGSCTITNAGSVYKINCADGGMDANFLAGDWFWLSGSTRNDGYYSIKSVNDLYIETNEALDAQATASTMTLTIITIPAALKVYFAQMIAHQVYHIKDSGLQSENIGNYSYSRAVNVNDAGYPKQILSGLSKWKRISTRRGSILSQIRDRRGVSIDRTEDIVSDAFREINR